MIRRGSRGRAGITLTEILISILIMGIGLVSLATLFPLGLLRLRNAARLSRSALMGESAAADVATRNLLVKGSFFPPTSPWYIAPYPRVAASVPYDPWTQDQFSATTPAGGVFRVAGPGLPVAYDPLWRAVTDNPVDLAAGRRGTFFNRSSFRSEARFGSGLLVGNDSLRDDPNSSGTVTLASAYGLPRITNLDPLRFIPDLSVSDPAQHRINYNNIFLPKVARIFVSPDDIVFQSTNAQGASSASTIVPDMSSGDTVQDWRYTWMFTGRRSNAAYGDAYEGDIVVFDSRPFAIDPTSVANQSVVAGETVVEAVFGYSKSVTVPSSSGATNFGYSGRAADRTVLLRWRATTPDPEVKVGSWIADVTYERTRVEDLFRWQDRYPGQRCHWYQVVKKSPAETAKVFVGDGSVIYRSMTVVVNVPLRAKTPLITENDTTRGDPFHVNAALVSPYVINVFPKTFTTR